MDDDSSTPSRDVVLGFNGALGFGRADLTSPAVAAAADALVDVALFGAAGADAVLAERPVTELRVHGVAGSDGPTMLEHPAALQVAGDTVTGFYRRWSPDGPGRVSVAWPLEAYSWGGLTEAPLASAAWLLLAPFMLYNVAHFALPPAGSAEDPLAARSQPVQHLDTTRGHRIASGLLRLLAVAATVQFVTAAGVVLVSTVAWQAAGRPGVLPAWMGWYGTWTAGWRVALALAAVAAVVAGLWWLSVTTAAKYEARTTRSTQLLDARWPLTQPGFWKGEVLVGRQRGLHSAAALASLALIGAMSSGHGAARSAAVILAAVALAVAAALACAPLAERHTVTLAHGGDPPKAAGSWCRWVLGTAGGTLLVAALVSGFTDRASGPQQGVPPGLTNFAGVLLAAQAALLIALAFTVAFLAIRAARATTARNGREDRPYLGGLLGPLFAAMSVLLGGLLSAVVNLGVTRLLGTPLPSGFRFSSTPPDALAVPWPIYVFGAAPVGLLAGGAVAAILLGRRYRGRRLGFEASATSGPSTVAAAYSSHRAQQPRADGDGDAACYARNRRAIAGAWAVGMVADDAAAALACAVFGGVIVVLAGEIAAALLSGSGGYAWLLLQGAASFIAVLGVLVAGWLLSLLRQDYKNATSRRNIGSLWDVFTFWPRAVHPLAPPCYGERAVPELVDRIRLLSGNAGDDPDDAASLQSAASLPDLLRTRGLTVPPSQILLTGYSQGSIIAAATIAQLPAGLREHVALLTLACPARRLYGRAFPAFFGEGQLHVLAELLDANAGPGRGRWKNLRRRSDYYGSWVFAEPEPRLSDEDLATQVDQPSWDPVVLVPDADPTPPPINRHSRWWQDPRTAEVGAYLVKLLATRRNGR